MSKKPELIRSLQVPPIIVHKYERYLPTAFDSSMSILEKINKLIHGFYEYTNVTIDMLDKWNEVYHWIMNDGLEELIRYRLDEMIQDGTFNRIINEEIFGELNDKINSLISDMENFKNDVINEFEELSKELDDKFNEFRNQILLDLENFKNEIERMVHEKVDVTGYYDEIEVNKYVFTNSLGMTATYYLTKVPKHDKDGNIIKMKQGFAHDDYHATGGESARSFSVRNGATLVSNVSASFKTLGLCIYNGEVLHNRAGNNYSYILAFNDNMEMRSYPPNTPPNTILNAGYNNAVTAFAPMIENGFIVPDNVLNSRDIFMQRHPRQAIAQDRIGNTYIVSVDGRKMGEAGMTARELAEVLISHGMVFAHMFDGGGSSQTIYYQSMINKITDRDSNKERERDNFLYFGKDIKNDPYTDLLAKQGDVNYFRQTEMDAYSNLRYTRNNYISLIPYLTGGWRAYSETGGNHPRAWIMPDMSVYMFGTVTGGRFGEPLMSLPAKYKPIFTNHFITPGNSRGQINKIIVESGGDLVPYKWSENSNNNYVKLDGIYFILNPDGFGI